MRHIETANYIRVDKKTARRLYTNGYYSRLNLCPVNLNPESPWGLLYWPSDNKTPFDSMINAYIYYNCNCSETGYYPAFYVPRDWWYLMQAASREFAPDAPHPQRLRRGR